MPSGYEKSEDYGGREPGFWGNVGTAAIFIALTVFLGWLFYFR